MAITFHVSRNENARYRVSQPCPNRPEKNPLPSVWRKGISWPKSTTEGWKIQAIARNVSGIIERTARVVAKVVPKRRPRTAGIESRIRPMTEMPSVHHVIGVPSGENDPPVSLKRSAMYSEARIMFSGATGNHPSQYAHAVNPLRCSAKRGHFSL